MVNPQLQQRLNISTKVLENFCQQHQIIELALFGSVLRADFSLSSDLDFLVTFSPNLKLSLMDLVGIQYELEELVKRDVDLIEKRAIANSQNWIRRENILATAEIIYEARPIISS